MIKFKNYHYILLIAVVLFLAFQWFSLKNSAENRSRLDSVKDYHYPLLETMDQTLFRLEQIKDLYLQAVLIGEIEMVVDANRVVVEMRAALDELTRYEAVKLEVERLIAQLDRYTSASGEVAQQMINGAVNADVWLPDSERMNVELQQFETMAQTFRQQSYANFIATLSRSETVASHLHLSGIILGVINLMFIATLGYLIASNNRMMTIIERQNETLEQRVAERTTALEAAQSELIKSEKMAALGGLVSGVAHEINTPLGVSITATSHLAEESRRFSLLLQEGKMKKSSLVNYVEQVDEGVVMLQANLTRAAELIKNFKQVAVDQSIEEIRTLNLGDYLQEVLSSLRPKWKHTQIELITDFADKVEITTYPGALAQIMTNFISNSIIHGFEDGSVAGEIAITLTQQPQGIELRYRDSGKGMAQESLDKIFDPFYTTRRGQGGTGLGMHIVYNLVTQKLKGSIDCHSAPNEGCRFTIILPERLD
ncbi:sensor histidine kinase [Ectothiorhodospiraceae bacterium BW-2]|nr:sensor histidine kinase [Ectothiorhodospiraceae bacterium BW-2]